LTISSYLAYGGLYLVSGLSICLKDYIIERGDFMVKIFIIYNNIFLERIHGK